MTPEAAAAHDSGDCLLGCSHPDHAFEGEAPDLGLFDDPERLPWQVIVVEAADDLEPEPEPVVL